jgi:hypothetical protein
LDVAVTSPQSRPLGNPRRAEAPLLHSHQLCAGTVSLDRREVRAGREPTRGAPHGTIPASSATADGSASPDTGNTRPLRCGSASGPYDPLGAPGHSKRSDRRVHRRRTPSVAQPWAQSRTGLLVRYNEPSGSAVALDRNRVDRGPLPADGVHDDYAPVPDALGCVIGPRGLGTDVPCRSAQMLDCALSGTASRVAALVVASQCILPAVSDCCPDRPYRTP